jgi:hypothetical protein
MLPTHIFHADWGTAANKRWLARATLGSNDRYTAHAPALIEDHVDLIPSIRTLMMAGLLLSASTFQSGFRPGAASRPRLETSPSARNAA